MSYKEIETIPLKRVADFVTIKVDSSKIQLKNYVSTENMLPYKSGLTKAASLPTGRITSFTKNDILISNIRPYFQKIWYSRYSGGCSTDVLNIRAKENIFTKYLYYVLSDNYFFEYVMKGSKGTKMPRGDKTHIMNYEFNLPSLNEQKAIANILSSLDDKIEINNKINKSLEKLAQTIYKHWFVDFEFPNEDGDLYQSSGGEMVESELGLIPKGWKFETLGESSISKILKSGIDNFDYDKVYLATADVTNTTITNHITKITLEQRPSRANMQPIKNTVWFAKMKNSRKLIRVSEKNKELLDGYIFSTGFAGIECIESLNYIWSFISTNEFDEKKNNMATGTTQEAINNGVINKKPLLIPSKKVLIRFEILTSVIYDKIDLNNQENIKLAEIRDLLLPKLMSGEIRVPIKE